MATTTAKATAQPAKKPAPQPAKKPAPKPTKKNGSLLFLLLLMPVALLLLPSTLVLIPAMVPTLVARVVDPGPGRHLTITVGALNFAGSLWFIQALWSQGQSFHAIAPTLGDPMGWLCALAGAGSGWTLNWVMPVISRRIAETKSSVRLSRLRKRQEELVEQWGDPVRKLAE